VVRLVAVVEEPAAFACRYRVHQGAEFVDQPGGEQLLHHGDRAGDEDAFDVRIGLERGDGSTRSPSISSELRQENSSGWRETTTLRMSPRCMAKDASSPPAASRSGHAPAKLS
jgi:hypothetical protein